VAAPIDGCHFYPTPTGSECEEAEPAQHSATYGVPAAIAEDRAWNHVAPCAVIPVSGLPWGDVAAGKNNRPGKQQREFNNKVSSTLTWLQTEVEQLMQLQSNFTQLEAELENKAGNRDLDDLQTASLSNLRMLQTEVEQLNGNLAQIESELNNKARLQDLEHLKTDTLSNLRRLQIDFEQLKHDFKQLGFDLGNKAGIQDLIDTTSSLQQLQTEVEQLRQFKSDMEKKLRIASGSAWWFMVLLLILVGSFFLDKHWDFAFRLSILTAPLSTEVCNASSNFIPAIFPYDGHGHTALCAAAADGDVDLVAAYLRNLDKEAINFECFRGTALIHAVMLNRTKVVVLMIDHDSVDINALGDNSNSALHGAMAQANLRVARALLNQRRFTRINHMNRGRISPLGKMSQGNTSEGYLRKAIARAIVQDPRFVVDPDEMIRTFGKPKQH